MRDRDKVLVIDLSLVDFLLPAVILADNQRADAMRDQVINDAPRRDVQEMVNATGAFI